MVNTTPQGLACQAIEVGTGLLHGGGLVLDLRGQRLPPFAVLAQDTGLEHLPTWRRELQDGSRINGSEQRAALHMALRAPITADFSLGGQSVLPAVHAARAQMRGVCQRLHAGQWRGATGAVIRQVVHVGLGGSGLAVRLVLEALGDEAPLMPVQTVTGGDAAALQAVLRDLDPATTLLVLASKSLATDDTLRHLEQAVDWLASGMRVSTHVACAAQVVAITAVPERAQALGIEHIFVLWNWVGGRFSLWSSMGLPVALALGFERFEALLAGAWAMDQHFLQADPQDNLPVLLALCTAHNVRQRHMVAESVVVYRHRLRSLPAHVQQLAMESTGKRVQQNGQPVIAPASPLVFGGVAPDVHHSYFQMLHQGPWRVGSELIAVVHDPSSTAAANRHLLAQCQAQAQALVHGSPAGTPAQQHCVGGQPVSVVLLPRLDAHSLGALLALYEHKVYVLARLQGINPFDQWGVELGKTLDCAPRQVDGWSNAPTLHDWLEVWPEATDNPTATS